MVQPIHLVFHRNGLRSFIEVDLCAACPRQDDKGCCGFYSPVFYPTDFGYMLLHQPDLIQQIFGLPHLTILDASVTVNSFIDVNSSYRCQFHTRDQGCLLPMLIRESVCRHFVCPGIGWWEVPALQSWKEYYDQLADYEIALNHQLAAKLKKENLSLRCPEQRTVIMERLADWIDPSIYEEVPLDIPVPKQEAFTLQKEILFGNEWSL